MTRRALPARRPSETFALPWRGHVLTVTVGYHPGDGAVLEAFADAPKGGELGATLADACVAISLALQHGVPPAALVRSIAREPDPAAGEDAVRPASPVGAILDLLADPGRLASEARL